jgi:transcriptional regulator with XRE-family HTH domain
VPQVVRLKLGGRRNFVGKRVKQLREERKLTQDALCARLALETSDWADNGTQWVPRKVDIHRIETGVRAVLDLDVLALAKALGVEPGELLLQFDREHL